MLEVTISIDIKQVQSQTKIMVYFERVDLNMQDQVLELRIYIYKMTPCALPWNWIYGFKYYVE